jgi:hypothetical protein
MTPEEEEFEFAAAALKRKQAREAAQADPSLQTAVLPPVDKPSTLGQDVLSGAKDFVGGAAGQALNMAQSMAHNRPSAVGQRLLNKTLGRPQEPDLTSVHTALPQSMAGRVGAAAPQLALGLAAPMNLAPQVVTNAGLGMLDAEPGNELVSGGVSGLLGGVGSLGARGLARTRGGLVIPASDFPDMAAQGIRPTLGMAAARGGEKGTVSGDAIRALEKGIQELPVSGMPLRRNIARAGEDVTTAAAKLGNIPGQPLPEFLNRQDLINKLRERGNTALSASDAATVIPMTSARRTEAAKFTEDVANKYQLDAGEKQELSGFVARGLIGHVPKGMPADLTGAVAKSTSADLRSNLPHNLRRDRVQRAANDIAGMIDGWVDEASAAVGKGQKPLRTALADVHVMQKAPGKTVGMSGEDLAKGISENDEAMKTLGSHSPEMLELAKASRGVTSIPNKYKLTDHYVGSGSEAAGLLTTGGGANAAAAFYGKLSANPRFLRMVMNDPALQAKWLKRLRGSGSAAAAGGSTLVNSGDE